MDDAITQWFDPAEVRCKSPYGAVGSGTKVTFTVRPRRQDCFAGGVLTARWEFDDD